MDKNSAKPDSVKLYKIRKTLNDLSQQTGHGTELITVYIPKAKQLHGKSGAEAYARTIMSKAKAMQKHECSILQAKQKHSQTNSEAV